MTLDELNAMPRAQAESALRSCATADWASSVAMTRPYDSLAALLASADRAWRALGPDGWREMFAHHPRIGERDTAVARDARSRSWAAGEQAVAGSASATTRDALAHANREYEERFGHIYLVCATGKSAAEILEDLRARMANAPARELAVAAEEQRKIIHVRLRKLLDAAPEGPS